MAEDARYDDAPLAECEEHGGDDRNEFELAPRHEYAYGTGVTLYVELGREVEWIAVDMRGSGLGAAHGETRCAECAYLAVIADETCKHLDTGPGILDYVAVVHDCDVEAAVADRGGGSYEGIVAVLGGVAYRHEKCALGDDAVAGDDLIGAGVIFYEFVDRTGYV